MSETTRDNKGNDSAHETGASSQRHPVLIPARWKAQEGADNSNRTGGSAHDAQMLLVCSKDDTGNAGIPQKDGYMQRLV